MTMSAEKEAAWKALKKRLATGQIKMPDISPPKRPCTDHMRLAVRYAAEGIFS